MKKIKWLVPLAILLVLLIVFWPREEEQCVLIEDPFFRDPQPYRMGGLYNPVNPQPYGPPPSQGPLAILPPLCGPVSLTILPPLCGPISVRQVLPAEVLTRFPKGGRSTEARVLFPCSHQPWISTDDMMPAGVFEVTPLTPGQTDVSVAGAAMAWDELEGNLERRDLQLEQMRRNAGRCTLLTRFQDPRGVFGRMAREEDP